MTQHHLLGRTERELLCLQRRSFIQAAALWTGLGGFGAALAEERSNVVELQGDVLLNGERLLPQQFIQTGDTVETGPDSHLVFVIGDSAFQLRQKTRLVVERGTTLNTCSVLELTSGAVLSVWGKQTQRLLVTPSMTAVVAGAAVYAEVVPGQDGLSYLCNCYGDVRLSAGTEKIRSHAEHHHAFWGEVEARGGHFLTPAKNFNHSDEEVEFLARLVAQHPAWKNAQQRSAIQRA